jgi:probable F420-dependent oxidoreductase
MVLTLETALKIGVSTIHRIVENPGKAWQPGIDELVDFVRMVDDSGFDSIWSGDHLSFPQPILDPFLQLAQAAVVSRRLLLGSGVYLLPLRHPVPVAKQVATLDHLTEGRFIFGVGVGGEFPNEFAAAGVPVADRGGRLTEGISVMRRLWSGEPVTYEGRYFNSFDDVSMRPPTRTAGGPPIWCGGRQKVALERAGRLADGWIAYAISPEMFKSGLETIKAAADAAGRSSDTFGTGHLLFTCLADTYEQALDAATAVLSRRYAMDFRRAAERYAALGPPERVAARIRDFHAAGARHIVLDVVSEPGDRVAQIARFGREVLPLLADLR